MLRTAIIGISGYGREHLRLLMHGHKRGILSPEAAVVIDQDDNPVGYEQLKALGCRIYGSVEEMWVEESGSIDLCMIPSPIATHYPFTKMALENGSHVFVEKPVCGTIQEVNELVALADTLKLTICVGFQDIYSPQVQAIKKRLVDGELGRIKTLKGWGSWPRAKSYYGRNGWAGEIQVDDSWVLDSPINNAMAHFLNILIYWSGDSIDAFGDPVSLQADLYRAQEIPSFDTASLRMTMRGGAEIFYGVTHSGHQQQQVLLQIEGEKGSVDWTHFGELSIRTASETKVESYIHIDVLREKMIEDVYRYITSGSGQVVTARNATTHTRAVNALHETCPIHQFPANRISTRGPEDEIFRYVPGLEQDLESAFREEKLLSELMPEKYPAHPEVVSLEQYFLFSGPQGVPSLPKV